MEENKKNMDFEALLLEGLRRAMKKMIDYKVRNDEDLVISDSKGNMQIIKAKDYVNLRKKL
ncbi:MAG: hypothetical protein IAF38_17520 [Bacteroidia bacterium]|nr:hypothetical protein [Bacteroidia bacterium]